MCISSAAFDAPMRVCTQSYAFIYRVEIPAHSPAGGFFLCSMYSCVHGDFIHLYNRSANWMDSVLYTKTMPLCLSVR